MMPVLALLSLLVVFMAVRAFLPAPAKLSDQPAEQPGITTEGAVAEGDAAVEGSAESDETQDATIASSDSRDADFAVDPSRTEWVFDQNDTKTVWLTFDDGPSENTERVLDILDRYGIKATFFVTGSRPDYYYMIKECYDRGHTIGLHTYSHDYETVYASKDAYWADLNAIGEVVKEQIGYVPCFIRFPGGSSNTISADYTPGIMTELAHDVVDAGYQYYDWDASCGDGAEHSAEELVAVTEEGPATAYTNVIFLMHDSGSKDTTVEALPQIIEYFQSQGYGFAALDRETCVTHHGINN